MKKAYLVLSNGQAFEGLRFGADGDCVGELVFTTGMVGYLEGITDPSYYGQIVVQTFPQIGNYGVIEEDFEGKPALKAYVVRQWCETPSNFRSQYDIDTFLKNEGVAGIYGVDTRQITRIIRENGVMNATIVDEIPEDLEPVRAFKMSDAVENVTSKEITTYPADGEKKFSVALLDYGVKRNMIRKLCERGCEVTVYPASTTAEEILAAKPNGVMLSNGPGDPLDNPGCIETIKALFGKLPIFGICLGHQMLAIAAGAQRVKLKYGHRGGNQPVSEVMGTRTYITSQNHGYAVVADGLQEGYVSFVNANDGTCEGMEYPEKKAFSVQFHPEACSGPQDTCFLFDKFTALMGGEK